jgi:mannose-6-phosphate isomerase class I
VHSEGEGNLVLEISATPYIFTFKMYDWLRLDLEGKPRPINIEHAFNNLDFNRKGSLVKQELISKPTVIATGKGWELIHLPTHREHFYDVHRVEFDSVVEISNQGRCHVLMLVEGESILIETANGRKHTYAFAETFVIPAAAGSYRLTNLGVQRAKVVKAFLK